MKQLPFLTALFSALLLLQVQAQQEGTYTSRLGPADREAVRAWLQKDCDVRPAGATPKIRAQLEIAGHVTEPAFWEAYDLGPDPADFEKKRASAKADYIDRQRWLRASGEQALGRDEQLRQLSISEDDYVRRVLQTYTLGFKGAALAGLGIVGNKETLSRLQAIADEKESMVSLLAGDAAQALRFRLEGQEPR